MEARMFVVNKESRIYTLEKMEVSILVPEPKKLLKKTLLDIVNDFMQIEIGDYIFFWESGYERICGIYRAVSHPYYSCEKGHNNIFHIKIDTAYNFEKPISTYSLKDFIRFNRMEVKEDDE